MTNLPFDSLGLQYAWDSTSLGWAETCLRKYYYYMIEGWRRSHNSVHLEFGGLYASALEQFHKWLALGFDREVALREVVRDALESTWDSENNCPREFDHNTKTRANLIRTIVWYVDHWKDDPLKTVILSDGKPAVEHSFKIDFGDGLMYCGHIDRLVEWEGAIYIQDQKTTQSTITSLYFDQFSPDTQMTGYAWAGQAIYHSAVKGVIIDAAQIAVGFSRFERGFTFRTKSQLEEWYRDSHYHIARAREATEENYFPQNRKSCNNYGGCEFRGICSRSPEVRESFLKAEFVKDKRWNPLEAR